MICYCLFGFLLPVSSPVCLLYAAWFFEFATVSFLTLLSKLMTWVSLLFLFPRPIHVSARFASPDSPDGAIQPCSITRQLTGQWLSAYLAWGAKGGGNDGLVPCASIIHQELECNMPHQSTDIVSFLRRGFVTVVDPAVFPRYGMLPCPSAETLPRQPRADNPIFHRESGRS